MIDFGCGVGRESITMVQRGAGHVIGVDIRLGFLEQARQNAAEAGVAQRCTFATTPTRRADVVVSLDSFEHFDDPAAILRVMSDHLVPGGVIYASFGPTWYHPYGGHMFSIFPWAHLVFTERAMLNWRRYFRPSQTAERITECGLNKMTIARFERLVADSPFEVRALEVRHDTQATLAGESIDARVLYLGGAVHAREHDHAPRSLTAFPHTSGQPAHRPENLTTASTPKGRKKSIDESSAAINTAPHHVRKKPRNLKGGLQASGFGPWPSSEFDHGGSGPDARSPEPGAEVNHQQIPS